VREHVQHLLDRVLVRLAWILDAQLEVLPDGQRGEYRPLLGYVAEPQPRDPMVGPARDLGVPEPDRADRLDLSHDRLHRGGASHPVATEQGDNLALVDPEAHSMKDVALAIVGMQILDLEHHAASSPR